MKKLEKKVTIKTNAFELEIGDIVLFNNLHEIVVNVAQNSVLMASGKILKECCQGDTFKDLEKKAGQIILTQQARKNLKLANRNNPGLETTSLKAVRKYNRARRGHKHI